MRKQKWFIVIIIVFVLFLAIYSKSKGRYFKVSDYADEVIELLQKEISFEDEDGLTYNNGDLEIVEFKTKVSVDILFQCIRNSEYVNDLTGCSIEPMWLPIRVSGHSGTFDSFFFTYPESEQFLQFCFTDQDSEELYNYVMALTEQEKEK